MPSAGDRVEETREKESLLQRWIQSRLAFVSNEVNESLENYDAARAAHAVRSFVQNEFCSVFIEFAKPTQQDETCELAGTVMSASQVASEVLTSSLQLLHPFVPYVNVSVCLKVHTLKYHRNTQVRHGGTVRKHFQDRGQERFDRLDNISSIFYSRYQCRTRHDQNSGHTSSDSICT